jgi:hypothetical protein
MMAKVEASGSNESMRSQGICRNSFGSTPNSLQATSDIARSGHGGSECWHETLLKVGNSLRDGEFNADKRQTVYTIPTTGIFHTTPRSSTQANPSTSTKSATKQSSIDWWTNATWNSKML